MVISGKNSINVKDAGISIAMAVIFFHIQTEKRRSNG
jgi:hypothetical protein